jgi:hypothetical protein
MKDLIYGAGYDKVANCAVSKIMSLQRDTREKEGEGAESYTNANAVHRP